MEFPELDPYFQSLTDITDTIAILNSPYESDFDADISKMEDFWQDVQAKDWLSTDKEYFNLFTSHFSFHIKIVEEIVREAREILDPERRAYVKRLVSYCKSTDEWLTDLQKRRRSTETLATA
ncbi:PLU-1-like domain protein [Leptospira langatensis]|uniref:PLU-1-like domain protein n=1 Tax=Leptospira langatensis TaxID=2484983 RepID=A0A5F1ZPB5_9LEPT|nr:PLU-1-like domain protein [Leptospira langatensis]TGK02002.1 PLU-1-like domain protein [Leptospira langatensis]TGL39319.1 PLU-1-like domain protein [Leptospira langatensis]